mmetsp:Transcript_21015/g.66013  ORF Transcript_21015/g.66013 Transcript_21015/m.66013 type:complete len:125 (+) Transcript_21015:55-429(+)|eukprot:CAMPEP_0197393958 /NCGR_PEP_ID=MMETSP1165-20131217/4616_1 /TAXON_ID=284809 /ORGANISM="Chrysocystis fragilis, Strain CCMP3189" /LENGTH=124 /DNA_ID=CAMNT_0042919639 /DNA_START=44 /DNA_END=418 /DNA_ORIENTATION=+
MPMSKAQHDEACTVYAALALYDGGAQISADSIKALIDATGNEVEGYWPVLFARYLDGKIEDMILNVSAGGGGGGGGFAGGAGEGGEGGEGAAEEEKKEEEEEEEEIDMGGGMDMFGDGGGGDDY